MLSRYDIKIDMILSHWHIQISEKTDLLVIKRQTFLHGIYIYEFNVNAKLAVIRLFPTQLTTVKPFPWTHSRSVNVWISQCAEVFWAFHLSKGINAKIINNN